MSVKVVGCVRVVRIQTIGMLANYNDMRFANSPNRDVIQRGRDVYDEA